MFYYVPPFPCYLPLSPVICPFPLLSAPFPCYLPLSPVICPFPLLSAPFPLSPVICPFPLLSAIPPFPCYLPLSHFIANTSSSLLLCRCSWSLFRSEINRVVPISHFDLECSVDYEYVTSLPVTVPINSLTFEWNAGISILVLTSYSCFCVTAYCSSVVFVLN